MTQDDAQDESRFGRKYKNQNCGFARRGIKPYRRCDYCVLNTRNCLGIQNNIIAIAIVVLSLSFIFLENPLYVRITIVCIGFLLAVLGFKINTNLDNLARSERKNILLNTQLTRHSQNLESQVKERTLELEKMAIFDGLTGLVNRQEFEKRLSQTLEQSKITQQQHVLCFIDLDQFKIVNDTCGHVAGDELLRRLTPILTEHIRETDTAARFGGDEFGLLLMNSSIEEAQHTAERIRHSIDSFQFVWEGTVNKVGASIGVIGINENSNNLIEVLAAVDDACYKAKELGRNRVQVYEEDISDMARRHGEKKWASRLQTALEEDGFVLHLQPIVPLITSEEKKHYEVLLRMVNSKGEIIPPSTFLPAAERFTYMPKIDRWVIRNALIAYNQLTTESDIVLSINLSGASFTDDHLSGFVENELENNAVEPNNIIFEITETAAIGNLGKALVFINRLKNIGCQFSLDDFGSGLSSFSYLKSLPIDYLKIDGSFVKNMLDFESDLDMVRAMNQISHIMGKKTVAEFVESEQVRDALVEMGVDYAQGFALGRPVSVDYLINNTVH